MGAEVVNEERVASIVRALRGPLAPLTMAVRLLRGDGALSPGALRHLAVIERQLAALTRVVDDLEHGVDAGWTPAPAPPVPPVQHAPLRHRHILVVDDNIDLADCLAELLRDIGHRVTIAYGGASAIAIAAATSPDVVLMDIGMPDLDGYEVARRLRAGRQGRRMVLVAITGYGQERDRERAREAGFDHHLTKPVDVRILEALLSSLRAD